MIAKELISTEIPNLRPSDDGKKALEIMDNFLISNLAVVDENIFLGVISMDDIYNFDISDIQLSDFKKPLIQAFIYTNQHVFDAIKALSLFKTTILAVLDTDSNFLGIITQKSVLEGLSKIMSIKEDGYHLKFKLNKNDFSATEISNIVEKNDAKVLSLYIDDTNTSEILIYLKIFTQDIEAVLQSFERYRYDFAILNKQQEDLSGLYQERFDNFLHYLNI